MAVLDCPALHSSVDEEYPTYQDKGYTYKDIRGIM